MAGLNLTQAEVVQIQDQSPKIQRVIVKMPNGNARAVNYLDLGVPVQVGDIVTVNTTAVDLALGSGGTHFVVPANARWDEGWGHQMKLRYTPLQLRVNCAEEQDSPWHQRFQDPGGLEGIPVIAAELHSMLPPLALAIKELDPKAKVAYLSTDGGALPAAFSNNVVQLKELGAITKSISAGHSFGGDYESINVFTGLQAAGRVLEADYVIAAMGPGIAGTGTKFGFSGMEQGFVLQAAWAVGGYPVLAPRIGFEDHRKRHQGISHHTITTLNWGYAGPGWLSLPLARQPHRGVIARQARGISARYSVKWRCGKYIESIASKYPKLFASMGRGYQQNQIFFQSLGATARLAVELKRSKPYLPRIAIK